MTTEQFFLILGTIYIAPHIHPIYCQLTGVLFLITAACKGLGLI
jgi:hypothetical protein